MPDIELDLFDKLAFCWEFFEKDGLTGEKLFKYKQILKESILIVGSGQGIVAKPLIDKGFDVFSLDCLQSMATYAMNRYGIKTEVKNFIDLNIDKKFNTIIINTGVIYPKFIDSNSDKLINQLDYYLTDSGYIILSFFQHVDFDKIANILNINKKSILLFEIWQILYKGQSIVDFFKERFKEKRIGVEFIIMRYKSELEEFGQQILDAGCAYMRYFNVSFDSPKLKDFIIDTLYFVSYGLCIDNQLQFMNKINKTFKINSIETEDKLVTMLLSRKE